MNILIINQILHTAEKGIIPNYKSIKNTMIYSMCLGFLENGHTITLVASAEYKPTDIEIYPFEIKFFKSSLIRIFPPALIPFSFELNSYIKRNNTNYDLVVSSETFSFGTLFASFHCPEKTVVWQELTSHQKKFHYMPSKLWHWFIAPLFVNRVVMVIPRSKAAYLFIRQYVKCVTSTIVDHGVNVNKFSTSEIKKRQIISSSQLIARKNVEGIIDVFFKLNQIKGYDDIELIIAGKGDAEIELKEKVNSLMLKNKVSFVGFLNHDVLNKYIRESMVFLVNTRQDLNLVSLPESIVSGTPILTNCIPASAYYIEENRLGIAKDNWSEKELRIMIDNYKEYSKNCCEYRAKLTNDCSALKIIEVYQTNKK